MREDADIYEIKFSRNYREVKLKLRSILIWNFAIGLGA